MAATQHELAEELPEDDAGDAADGVADLPVASSEVVAEPGAADEQAWGAGAQAEAEAAVDSRGGGAVLIDAVVRLFVRKDGLWQGGVVEAFQAKTKRHRIRLDNDALVNVQLRDERWLLSSRLPPLTVTGTVITADNAAALSDAPVAEGVVAAPAGSKTAGKKRKAAAPKATKAKAKKTDAGKTTSTSRPRGQSAAAAAEVVDVADDESDDGGDADSADEDYVDDGRLVSEDEEEILQGQNLPDQGLRETHSSRNTWSSTILRRSTVDRGRSRSWGGVGIIWASWFCHGPRSRHP